MRPLKYLAGYPATVTEHVNRLIDDGKLAGYLLKKYPQSHNLRTDKALYTYVVDTKNQFLRRSNPLSKVVYDDKIDVIHQALGMHSFVSRVQGGNLKAKNEIRVASVFKHAPLAFLRMIVVHELAHLCEKDHNKAFYKLCEHMETDYHQLEFDVRLYLTCLDWVGKLY
jgi:predicted metal-dependent hydrolase